MIVTYLDVDPHEVPARMPSPYGPVHPLARRAAEQLRDELRGDPLEGKMFGVLVVEERGRIGFVRACSGMLDGRWDVEGFAPPVFDAASRDAFWPAAERELAELTNALAALDARIADARAAVDQHAAAALILRARHRERRAERHAQRASGADAHALDQQSRGDAAEKRRHVAVGVPLVAALRALEDEAKALANARAGRSRELLHRVFATYALANARGETRPLRDVFAPAEPPGGAGDCAAPKLLAYAYRHGLRPVALAEVWVGPASGGRFDGHYYPPCRGKCEPVLRHMLAGLDVEDPPALTLSIAADEPRTVFEDDWLLVVAKPAGLLSVPGKAHTDCVEQRLRARHAHAMLVHRLDLDTSGLLVAAKDPATHAALQAQFAERAIEKRYIAWLDGEPTTDGGTIDLPLRVDLDDRPRQLIDHVHGKPAITEWRVLSRENGRTRVAFFPRTGRAHQLRVHAACGIGIPIVGDRLYGIPSDRLLLHAEAIRFVHPQTNKVCEFVQRAPF